MSDEPPVVPYGEVLARRRQFSLHREPKLPQEYESIEAYHAATHDDAGERPSAVANVDYADLKARR